MAKRISWHFIKILAQGKMGKLILDGEQMERISKKFYYVTGYFHVIYLMAKRSKADIQPHEKDQGNGTSTPIIQDNV